MRVVFDVGHLYYLPQFLPVARALERRGARCDFVFYSADDAAREPALKAHIVDSQAGALSHYRETRPDWVVFGNEFPYLRQLPDGTRSALLYHGIGLKECYYDAELMEMDVRFVEGEHRRKLLHARYPEATLVPAGFAKLDPLFDGSLGTRGRLLEGMGLDPTRRTVLYAPTYYPSSIERLPPDWPAALEDLNLIVKPHQFTFSKPGYAAQRRRIAAWEAYPNVHLAGPEHYSILPYMACADILVSEASSAMFEFAALDRPIVWCDFYKLRWSYRGLMRFRFNQRMDGSLEPYRDIGAHAASPGALDGVIREELARPERYAPQRRRYVEDLVGPTDGHCSERVADYLSGA